MPLVTVIIPTYNRAEWLPGAVDSVLAQSFADIEIIVVDDCSDDDTVARMGPRMEQIRYIRQDRAGVASARNRGLAASRGALIAFLDSDDRFTPDKIASQVELMRAHPAALISHTDEVWYRRGSFLNQRKKHVRPSGYIFNNCLRLCCVGMSTVIVRPRFFELVGGFDPAFPCCEDYELWLRAASRLPFLLLPRPLTIKNGGRADQLSMRYRQGMDRFRIHALDNLVKHSPLSVSQNMAARRELVRRATIYGNGCVKHGRGGEGRAFLALAASTR